MNLASRQKILVANASKTQATTTATCFEMMCGRKSHADNQKVYKRKLSETKVVLSALAWVFTIV
jgi:hypothetical protein